MRILILGGTVFLGRHLAEMALEQRHHVTLFNRGHSHPGIVPGAEELHGDRDGGLKPLAGGRWDVVIDTSGYVPRVVRQSLDVLRDAVDRFIFISTMSVYRDYAVHGITEDYPLARLEDEASEDIAKYYGELKALCEAEVREVFSDRALIIRPGLIVGPYDISDRFTYWVRRFSEGGRIVVPDPPGRPLQFIDVRDLAGWILALASGRETGRYHATGPGTTLTMGALVDALKPLSKTAEPVWVPESFLTEHQVGQWVEIPLWITESEDWRGFMTADIRRALAHGLRFRPLSETIRDTLLWDHSRQGPPLRAGLSSTREAELLRAFENHSG